jgi:hypothetical protein
VPASLVTIESHDLETGERMRDVFEVTPAPEPGRERAVLAEVVAGIHPGAIERSYADRVGTFRDGRREITASLTTLEDAAPDGVPEPEPDPDPAQERLFDAGP